MALPVSKHGSGTQDVVFVHGVLDRGRSFDRVAALLHDECRMLWYDRRGYGSSVDAGEPPVGVDGHIDDLLEILDGLDGRRAVVVGHSFGGVTVVGAALRAPEAFAAVVLYETGMAWVPGWNDTMLRSLLWGEDPEGNGVRLMFGESYDRMSEATRTKRRREARAFVAEERSVRTGPPPYDVAELTVPLVFGSGDTYPFKFVAEHLERVVPAVELVTIVGGGHNAHRTVPDQFAALVRRGLARARPGR